MHFLNIDSHEDPRYILPCSHPGCENDGWFVVILDGPDEQGAVLAKFVCVYHLEEMQREERGE